MVFGPPITLEHRQMTLSLPWKANGSILRKRLETLASLTTLVVYVLYNELDVGISSSERRTSPPLVTFAHDRSLLKQGEVPGYSDKSPP
jgi:hypothetical protein